MLADRGYRVLEATDGQDALAIASAHNGAIDLVLTDVVMPGLSGPDLMTRLRPLHPSSKVLYISGYTDRTVPLDPDAEAAFIQKPFTPVQLGLKIREVLDVGGRTARASGA